MGDGRWAMGDEAGESRTMRRETKRYFFCVKLKCGKLGCSNFSKLQIQSNPIQSLPFIYIWVNTSVTENYPLIGG